MSPTIAAVATAAPPNSYTQEEILDRYTITDERIRSVFRNGGIERRHLVLPPVDPGTGRPAGESQGELLAKHRRTAIELGIDVVDSCLKQLRVSREDIAYLGCVTSTGFLTPGLSAWIIREMGLPSGCARADVVGMGCHGGLNGLTAVAGWAALHPGRLALLVCVEVCSAAYVFDGTMRTAVVNSLFGDGAAAVAVRAGGEPSGPALLRFASCVIPEAIEAMRYDWDDDHGKFSFYLDRDIPYVVGAHAEEVVGRLLAGTGLRRGDIAHWLVHSGGRKVIDAVRVNLGLTRHDLRHTSGVLRDYGNVSSGSFLFSYERLLADGVVRSGEYGVLMTMGPGSTIETALIQW
ncbi:3,5-dihydroxyphenylacetyl-CoA synthase DpgA [Streptosporangium sp. NPDC051023]|uniref:3,5-dihydroxyphenylacetyl-CoA synthase DpgA n=1 Tax=Streptosporangium sp. NPDC051023 TaxID=3155410 RepID=UPI0034503B6F